MTTPLDYIAFWAIALGVWSGVMAGTFYGLRPYLRNRRTGAYVDRNKPKRKGE